MPEIRVKGSEKAILCENGANLLQTLLKEGFFVDNPCNGNGTCGKCKVRILSGDEPGIRLSCLVEVTASCIYTQKGNKKIRKPQAANQTALIFDRRAAARLLSINSIRRLCWS